MMSTCSQIQKKKAEQSRDVILVLGGETVVLGQTAHWYASQREWYLISPSRMEAEADKQMDLLCLECSLGELDGLRYRDAAFVLEPARGIIRPFGEWTKHRVIGTQRHTCSYTQSISQSLCLALPSLFFNPPIFVSINWPSYYWLPCLAYHYVFWLRRSVDFLDFRQVYGVSQVSCQTPTNMTHGSLVQKRISWCVCVCGCVRAHMQPCVRARHTHHSMNGPANPVPSLPCFPSLSHLFCLFNSLSTTVLLLSCSARRAVIEGVRQKRY